MTLLGVLITHVDPVDRRFKAKWLRSYPPTRQKGVEFDAEFTDPTLANDARSRYHEHPVVCMFDPEADTIIQVGYIFDAHAWREEISALEAVTA